MVVVVVLTMVGLMVKVALLVWFATLMLYWRAFSTLYTLVVMTAYPL